MDGWMDGWTIGTLCRSNKNAFDFPKKKSKAPKHHGSLVYFGLILCLQKCHHLIILIFILKIRFINIV